MIGMPGAFFKTIPWRSFLDLTYGRAPLIECYERVVWSRLYTRILLVVPIGLSVICQEYHCCRGESFWSGVLWAFQVRHRATRRRRPGTWPWIALALSMWHHPGLTFSRDSHHQATRMSCMTRWVCNQSGARLTGSLMRHNFWILVTLRRAGFLMLKVKSRGINRIVLSLWKCLKDFMSVSDS